MGSPENLLSGQHVDALRRVGLKPSGIPRRTSETMMANADSFLEVALVVKEELQKITPDPEIQEPST